MILAPQIFYVYALHKITRALIKLRHEILFMNF